MRIAAPVGHERTQAGPPSRPTHASHFTARYERRVIPVAGHFLSREAPDAVVQAVRDLGR
jgi:pimeloyl-ACP methyl ester carboxylesterase